MSANTETTGVPPKGYVECPKKCGRWKANRGQIMCWRCFLPNDGAEALAVYDRAGCGDWTPPIAAPAGHVERRKGQRWKHVNSVGRVTEWTLDAYHAGKDSGWDATGRGGVQGYVMDTCWSNATITMALLADAPPEPAKDHASKCQEMCAAGTCKDCDREFAESSKYPTVQEAPKAAPACCTKDESTVCDGSLLERIICRDVPPILMCDAHWMLRESRMIEGVKAPYAGPERLPKPQLAADWVEDCLPESDR